MARKVRVTYPRSVYHVMGRGNERGKTYFLEEDYEMFRGTLIEGLERFQGIAHSWCLMPNHYHLALETPLGNLPRIMSWLHVSFLESCHFLERIRRSLAGNGAKIGRRMANTLKQSEREKKCAEKLKQEDDRRIAVWVRIRLLGPGPIDLARELGYCDGSAITQEVKRLEMRAMQDESTMKKLKEWKKLSGFTD